MSNSAEAISFNFSAISNRDEIGYACQRPGYSSDNEKVGAVKDEDVEAWFTFMNNNNIKHVISFLGDDEIQWYQSPMEDLMKKNGFDPRNYTRSSVKSPGVKDLFFAAFKKADEKGEKFVVHCSGGSGRASLAAALWLNFKYGLEPEAIITEITAQAKEMGVNRNPNADKLKKLLSNGTLG